ALAHVDAGGLAGAVRSLLADGTNVEFDGGAWPLPPLLATLPRDDTTCNGGLGFLLALPADRAGAALRHLAAWTEPHHRIGRGRACRPFARSGGWAARGEDGLDELFGDVRGHGGVGLGEHGTAHLDGALVGVDVVDARPADGEVAVEIAALGSRELAAQ